MLRAAGAARRSVELHALSLAMATALVGGINQLVLATVEEGGTDRLDRLEATIVELVESTRAWRPAAPFPTWPAGSSRTSNAIRQAVQRTRTARSRVKATTTSRPKPAATRSASTRPRPAKPKAAARADGKR